MKSWTMPVSTVYKGSAPSEATEGCIAYSGRVAQQTPKVECLDVVSLQVMENRSSDKGLSHPRRSINYNPGAIHSQFFHCYRRLRQG